MLRGFAAAVDGGAGNDRVEGNEGADTLFNAAFDTLADGSVVRQVVTF